MAQSWQPWFCERCGVHGVIRIRSKEGVFQVKTRLGNVHQASSPDCGFETYIRVGNPHFDFSLPKPRTKERP